MRMTPRRCASGNFDGYRWCLVVEEFPQGSTCISIEGAAAVEGERLPEGEQLLSGSCDGPIDGARLARHGTDLGAFCLRACTR